MYQNCCKKCKSKELYTAEKGNNTGLYCSDCGAWIKWLGKEELRAFENSMREATKAEREAVDKYIESKSEPVYTLSQIKEVASIVLNSEQNKHLADDPNHYLSKGIQMLVIKLSQL